jgi:hypothetical protein
MIIQILLGLSVVVNIVIGYICFRLFKKLLAFDDLFETLAWDIDKGVAFFKKLMETPTFVASPEITEAHNSMRIIGMRLEEFVLRMRELTNKEKPLKQEKSNNPPVVI